MMKRLIFSMMFILAFFAMRGQDMNPELPLNPKVKHGTLSNGLNYYILHNEEPKNRANFYIAQKVGSTLETPQQLGLAHFLEHMAFNGTKNYPGDNLLNYLEHKGIRFGADINAYTAFDETVYNINNVPTNDKALMDSVLLVLSDWSGSILLEDAEIDAERGVIQGEYTSRNNASTRMYTTILPKLYEEYQYHQMPIGSMEVVKNFPYEDLRNYYRKWYRPDLQGIVIVGDFDADEMEKKVIELFSQIPMPENAAERVYPTISDNQKPIYVTFEDPELQLPRIDTYFKFERTPFELRNTMLGYLYDNVASAMVATMINNRLNEYAQKADCPYSYAGVSIGTYLVSKQKGAFNVVIIPKDNYITAYDAAMGIIARACKTGFMGTEVQRVRDQIIADMESRYNERDKTNNGTLAQELIEHFIDNEPAPGIEIEHELVNQVLPLMPEQELNHLAAGMLHIENVAVVISQPNSLGLNIPAENEMITELNNIINADYEPYVDEVITEPLIATLPAKGQIVSTSANLELGTKEYTLSNGVKVVVKATDYANDEILINMFKAGGMGCYPANEAGNVIGQGMVLEVSQIGPFNPTRLSKYLAGKNISLNYNVANENNVFSGSSVKKDLGTLFELLYASFTDVSADVETYDANMAQMKTFLANQSSNPEYIFLQKRMKELYPNTPQKQPVSLDLLSKMNYDKMLEIYKNDVKNASEYTLVITGNVEEETLRPLLEQYIASLPSGPRVKSLPIQLVPMTPVAGKKFETIEIPAQSPSVFIFDCITQPGMKYSVKNDVMVDLLGDVLYMIYLETLREEMGGTYSPRASASLNPYTSTWQIVWDVTANPDMYKEVVDRANVEFEKLMKNGTDMKHFSKVREAAVKVYENAVRTNSYWLATLLLNERGFNTEKDRKTILETLTLDEFNSFIKKLYNGKNRIEIIGIAK